MKGVKGDWKMGMISDCYQLQENQRKNDPLTVKTPSPLHWFPSCLVDAGRQVAGALSPADPPAAALPSSSPPSVTLPAGRIQTGCKAPQSLARQRLPANAEKVQIPALTEGQVVQVGRIMQAVKMGQGVPLVPVPLLPISPSDPPRSCSSDPPAVQLSGAAGLPGFLRSSFSGWVKWVQGGFFDSVARSCVKYFYLTIWI